MSSTSFFINVGPTYASRTDIPNNQNFKQFLNNPCRNNLTFEQITDTEVSCCGMLRDIILIYLPY